MNFGDVAKALIAPLDNITATVNGSDGARRWRANRVTIDANSWKAEVELIASPGTDEDAQTAIFEIELLSYNADSIGYIPIYILETLGPREPAAMSRTRLRGGLVVENP